MMTGLTSLSFEAFSESIVSSKGNTDAFKTLLLERTGEHESVTITEHGNPCFTFQMNALDSRASVEYVETYAQEVEKWF